MVLPCGRPHRIVVDRDSGRPGFVVQAVTVTSPVLLRDLTEFSRGSGKIKFRPTETGHSSVQGPPGQG